MIQLTPQVLIYVATQPADFRCEIPGLSAICRTIFHENPLEGAVFVFRNRRATALKLLFFDGDAMWLCQRQLAKGHYKWWPTADKPLTTLAAQELMVLLWNGDPSGVFSEPWRRLSPLRLHEKKQQDP